MVRNLISSQSSESKQLLDQLLKAGLLTKDQIDVILFDHAETSIPICEIMLQRSWIKEKTVTYFMQSIVLAEKVSPPTKSIEKQLSQLRQQQEKLRNIKNALEQEIENLRREKKLLHQHSRRQHRKDLNSVDYARQASPNHYSDTVPDNQFCPDSIQWLG